MTDEIETKLFLLLNSAEDQQATVTKILEALTKEREALTREREQLSVVSSGIQQCTLDAVTLSVRKSFSEASSTAMSAFEKASEPVLLNFSHAADFSKDAAKTTRMLDAKIKDSVLSAGLIVTATVMVVTVILNVSLWLFVARPIYEKLDEQLNAFKRLSEQQINAMEHSSEKNNGKGKR